MVDKLTSVLCAQRLPIPSTCNLFSMDTILDFTFLYINFPISVVLPTLAAHSWFFDDANAVGTLAELSQVVDIVRREGSALGILLNNDKSSIWSPLALGPGEKDPLQRWYQESGGQRHQTSWVPHW